MEECRLKIEALIDAHERILSLFLPSEEHGRIWVQGFIEGLKCALKQIQKD